MCIKNETLKPIMVNGEFFDFFPQSGHPMIVSYRIKSNILDTDKQGKIIIGGKEKQRKELRTIYELRHILEWLVNQEVELVNRNSVYDVGINLDDTILTDAEIKPFPFHVTIAPEDQELLIDQLIFDVLFSKYCSESPRMTLRQYSLGNNNFARNKQDDEKSKAESVRKCIAYARKKQTNIMNNPELRKQIEALGVNPDKYFVWRNEVSSLFTNGKRQEIHKKAEIEWDYIYYNGYAKLITGKQYARSFSKSGNYSHDTFVELFDAYDQFVNEIFIQQIGNSKDYFSKSMRFYALEIYKRLDFIYKLAVRLENINLPVIDKDSILIKRFHPCVCDVIDLEGSVAFNGSRHKYYRPMLMLEDAWQQKEAYNNPGYGDKWQKYYFIRAKVYELFEYHFQFISDDYDEISDFIEKHYNVLQYHEPRKVWIQNDKEKKSDQEARIVKALEINEALFGYSEKRIPVPWNYL